MFRNYLAVQAKGTFLQLPIQVNQLMSLRDFLSAFVVTKNNLTLMISTIKSIIDTLTPQSNKG